MPLPTLQKTWQFNVNNALAASGTVLTTHRQLVRALKNALIGFASTPWVVRYSCNGTVAGAAGDLVDRWTVDTDLVWGVGAHSWIVLRQAGIGATFDMLIAMPTASNSQITIETSITGFTGGTTTSRPTAADSVSVHSGAFSTVSDSAHRWSVFKSTDGECTRIALAYGSNFTYFLLVDKPSGPTTGWSNPYFTFSAYSGSNLTPTLFILTAGTPGRMRHAGATGNVAMTIEGIGNVIVNDTTIGNMANEIDNTWGLWPLAMAGVTATMRGRHGNIYDLWMISAVRGNSDMLPGDGSNQFAVFEPFVFPWDGSAAAAFS